MGEELFDVADDDTVEDPEDVKMGSCSKDTDNASGDRRRSTVVGWCGRTAGAGHVIFS